MDSSASRSLDRLLAGARRGSRPALDRLMESFRPWLRHRVRARLPRALARKHDGSDLVQDCQYLAALRIGEFQGQSLGEFRGWLAGILDRRLLLALRFWGEQRRDRDRERPLNQDWESQPELAASSTSVLGRLSRDEECERLRLAAGWCREEDRAVISLHLHEGRSHEEIAAEWGIAGAVVRQRYCRAVRRVGEAMRLLDLMTRRGINGLQQDVIGVHRFQKADPATIAERLQLPRDLVARWIAEAKPLLREIAKDDP